jgi:competence protein ComEC
VFAWALAAVLVATVRPLAPPGGRAWLVVLDVGQGDALALGFEDGWWLVDAGPRHPRFDAGESVVAPFFRWAGVRRLEGLILTHDDGDHTGGAAAVRRGLQVRRMLAAPALDGASGPGARFGASRIERGETLHVRPPLIVKWPPGAREITRDPRAWSPHQSLTSPDNAAGVVLEMGSVLGRAVLLADVDSLVEERLELERGAAVLKVGHHGSASSTGAGFVRALAPQVAVIPVGRRNRFGHPAPAVLQRLRASGVRVHRTDLEGALWFELGPDGARTVRWRDGAPSRTIEPRAMPPRAGPYE